MEVRLLIKQIMDLKKVALDNTFAPIVAVDRQIEEAVETVFKYSTMFSEQDKAVIMEWLRACRQGIERFKAQNDEYYNRVAAFFSGTARQM
jgi:hypothetical protein